ncbi:hypothetical protein ACQP25_03945 [Microtetraspora malaysiensis]|uniref:hypothetical protein n=1 Tax=Microtetraspora malaysiensis TaxID=161358 RepID=UPI003D8E72DC
MAHPTTIPPNSKKEPRRHAIGRPSVRVYRRDWDADKRRAAAQLDQAEPAWLVSYGLGSRRFFAVAAWPVSRPLIVEAINVDELRDLMREAELTEIAANRAYVPREVRP